MKVSSKYFSRKYSSTKNYLNRRKTLYLIFFIFFFLTVGYSSLGTTLSLRGQLFVKVDKIAPKVEYSVLGGSYNTNQTIMVTPFDNESGVDYYSIYVYKDNNLLNSYENLETENYEITLSEIGTYEIRTKVVDKFGNVIIMEPLIDGMYYQTYLIDKEKPILTTDITYTDGTEANITIIAEDNVGGSGLSNDNNYQYCISSSNSTEECIWNDYNSSESFIITGNNEVKYLFAYPIKDNAENTSGDNEDITIPFLIETCYFDLIAPTLTISSTESGDNITITVTDEVSGLSEENVYKYYLSTSSTSLTGGNWIEYSSGETIPITLTQDTYVWVYPIKDKVGNVNDNKVFGEPYVIKTLYKIYTITYDLDGGTLSTANPSEYTSGTDTFTLTNPTKTGYTFAGWTGTGLSSASTSVIINKGSTGDRSYMATWEELTYTITYNCNGGSGSTASSTHSYNVAKTLTQNGCYKVTSGTSGMVYAFMGWNTDSSATEALYTNTLNVVNVNDGNDVTLYAVWKPLFSYNGSYNVLNDGNGKWRVKFLGGGTFTPNVSTTIDVFAVGGGGGGGTGGSGYASGGGGGGGYTTTKKYVTITANNPYSIKIGAGGTAGQPGDSGYAGGSGGQSSGFGVSANGGKGSPRFDGGSGGSGGGGSWNSVGAGGSYGNNGKGGIYSSQGKGQGTTTCEFGEGTLSGCTKGTAYAYAGGGGGTDVSTHAAGGVGGGGGGSSKNGVANTGGGGGGGIGGGNYPGPGGTGGSGIVVIRNSEIMEVGDIKYTYTGLSETVDDGNGNWRIKFLSSGTFTPLTSVSIDVFAVGGGGGGATSGDGYASGGGGGGGYTSTNKNISISANSSYDIVVGLGGTAGLASSVGYAGGNGGASSGFGVSANGGKGSSRFEGGAGGSGGGGSWSSVGNGGSYGNNGGASDGGAGQGSTTCEFGEGTTSGCNSGVTAYAGGGGGDSVGTHGTGGAGGGGNGGCTVGADNTGGGGGGGRGDGNYPTDACKGGSGIVIIRKTKVQQAGDMQFTYTGSSEIIDDGNGNWRIKFLSSGIFTPLASADIDVFVVGGGGGGATSGDNYASGGGGGGGYTTTEKNISINSNSSYNIVVGLGGTAGKAGGSNYAGGDGGTSSGFGVSAAGGKGSPRFDGGSGGSGGGGSWNSVGNGGSYGNNGSGGVYSEQGKGQGTTTCEFGEGTLSGCTNGDEFAYAGGGGGDDVSTHAFGGVGGGGTGGCTAGTDNKGGGGGGGRGAGNYPTDACKGGSGVVIIRNKR